MYYFGRVADLEWRMQGVQLDTKCAFWQRGVCCCEADNVQLEKWGLGK